MPDWRNISEGDKKLLTDVESHGWHVVKVSEDETGPGFGYSVGLYHSFLQPEILVIGLKLELIHSIINEIGERIRKGEEFTEGKYCSGLIEGFNCYFLKVDHKFFKEYVGYDLWYYENSDFPLLQCVYPTTKGIYPWEPEWPESISALQPLLGKVE